MPSSSLLVLDNEKILIDAGLGVAKSLTEMGFHLSELSNIFITYLHSDHYLELSTYPMQHGRQVLLKKLKFMVQRLNRLLAKILNINAI